MKGKKSHLYRAHVDGNFIRAIYCYPGDINVLLDRYGLKGPGTVLTEEEDPQTFFLGLLDDGHNTVQKLCDLLNLPKTACQSILQNLKKYNRARCDNGCWSSR